MLLMKKIFFDAIRAGAKTSTLRYWYSARVRPGSAHRVPGLGGLRIDSVTPVTLSSLTRKDALADGFRTLAALRSVLSKLYPPAQRDGRRLYLVKFTYLG